MPVATRLPALLLPGCRKRSPRPSERHSRTKGLTQWDPLARALDVPPDRAAGILRRAVWPIGTSLWLVETLGLPVHVELDVSVSPSVA